MKIDKKYLKKYYQRAAVDQLRDEYLQRGYDVKVEERLGNYRIDMVARKGESILFFEVKTGNVRAETKHQIRELSRYLSCEYPNGKLLLVAVRYPEDDTIFIEDIETILFQYFISNGTPSDLDELSTHTTIEDIESVNINSIEVSRESIKIECEGKISVQLDYDSHESDTTYEMSFPFKLEGLLEYKNGNLEMTDMIELDVDTSEFYE